MLVQLASLRNALGDRSTLDLVEGTPEVVKVGDHRVEVTVVVRACLELAGSAFGTQFFSSILGERLRGDDGREELDSSSIVTETRCSRSFVVQVIEEARVIEDARESSVVDI